MLSQTAFTIFDVPDAIKLIAVCLPLNDLASCVCVCKQWEFDFKPWLWKTIIAESYDSYDTSDPETPKHYGPSRAPLTRNSCLIHSLTADSFRLIRDLSPECTNLTFLDFSVLTVTTWIGVGAVAMPPFDHNHELVHLIMRNKRLKEVHLKVAVVPKEVNALVQALGSLSRLEILTFNVRPIRRGYWGPIFYSLATLCRQLKTLVYGPFDSKRFRDNGHKFVSPTGHPPPLNSGATAYPEKTTDQMAKNEGHNPLQHLALFGCTNETIKLVPQWSHLNHLEIVTDCVDNRTRELFTAITNHCRSLTSLKTITLNGEQLPGPDTLELVGSISVLQSLTLSQLSNSVNMAQLVVRKHWSTLESFEMKAATVGLDDSVVLLLEECPNLTSFRSNCSVSFSRFRGSKWACASRLVVCSMALLLPEVGIMPTVQEEITMGEIGGSEDNDREEMQSESAIVSRAYGSGMKGLFQNIAQATRLNELVLVTPATPLEQRPEVIDIAFSFLQRSESLQGFLFNQRIYSLQEEI